MINRKRKREKIKIQKKLKRTFWFKRIYRKKFRDFRNQMKSSIILMNSILEKKIIKSEILRFQWKNMCI